MLNLSSGLDYGAERQVLDRIRNSAKDKDKVKAKRPTGGDVQAWPKQYGQVHENEAADKNPRDNYNLTYLTFYN